jgi:gamma-tubulin complex component 5
VERQLDGLEERFRVLNRGSLADALRDRLDALGTVSNKFTPDTLHFLLELSDQPVQKTLLEDLERLRQPAIDPGESIRWEDIAKEDGWASDADLWKKVDFRDDSSDDELVEVSSDVSVKSGDTSPSSIEAHHRRRAADLIVDSQDEHALEKARVSQAWRANVAGNCRRSQDAKGGVVLSELQAVREVLFMLQGLRNDLFDSQYRPSATCRLQHASVDSFHALMGRFGRAGQSLQVLREFTRKQQHIPLLQVFQGSVENRLRDFSTHLGSMETGLIDIKENTVVSLVKVFEDTRPYLTTLTSLRTIVQTLEREKYSHPFRYLELLYDSATISQLEGDEPVYQSLGTIFFECFMVYIRPIRRWMQDGELIEGDKTFFISQVQSQLPLSRVWQDQFALRKTADGILHAPRFLQPAVGKIFETGKSMVILRHLGKHNASVQQLPEPVLDFQALTASQFGSFAPFSEIFNASFEEWMQSKHHSAAATLRQVLFNSCGLWSVLSDLEYIYLMADGSRSDTFAHALFNNLDLLNPRWNDRLLLTQSFQDAFGPVLSSTRINISALEEAGKEIVAGQRSVRRFLPTIKVDYRMSWPIRIVLSEVSLGHYQAVFTLLLQTRQAVYALQKSRLLSDDLSAHVGEQVVYYGLRSKLLWFLGSLQAYLSNIVLAPLSNQLKEDLRQTQDVDSMISVHSAFAKQLRDSACLGSKLEPIRDCMLDMMDLAMRLEEARGAESERQAEETEELSRRSLSTPARPSPGRTERYMEINEEEDQTFLAEQDRSILPPSHKPYGEELAEIRTQLDRHLKFICGGLRGVARASADATAGKWDILAEVLEVGVNENPW